MVSTFSNGKLWFFRLLLLWFSTVFSLGEEGDVSWDSLARVDHGRSTYGEFIEENGDTREPTKTPRDTAATYPNWSILLLAEVFLVWDVWFFSEKSKFSTENGHFFKENNHLIENLIFYWKTVLTENFQPALFYSQLLLWSSEWPF